MIGGAVRPIKVADQVVEELLDGLRAGELAAGDRLPAERELAARLGVSRTSLRDALRRLELLGHLEVRPGDGTYLRVPDSETLSVPFRTLVSTLPQGAADLLEFRSMLEPEVAALAAQRLSATGERQLLEVLERHRTLTPDSPRLRLVREDARFHDALAQMAGNTVVVQVLSTLRAMLTDVRLVALPAAGFERTLSDHQRIVQAVLAQDRDGARQAMRDHLEEVTLTYLRASSAASPPLQPPARRPDPPPARFPDSSEVPAPRSRP